MNPKSHAQRRPIQLGVLLVLTVMRAIRWSSGRIADLIS